MAWPTVRANVRLILLASTLMLPSGRALAQQSGVVTQVAAGYSFACALTAGGGVKCWGDNTSGQLGDNSNSQRLAPVDVSGLSVGVVAVATGQNQACALTSSGGVKCWGDNASGQLGDNSTLPRWVPGDVYGLTSGAVAIGAGWFYTCALTASGGVKCWGNIQGVQSNVPVDISGLASGVVAIAVNGLNACAVTALGGLKCWGGNANGQLGDNSISPSLAPIDVYGLGVGVRSVAVGYGHVCALMAANDGVKCWGYNWLGQVGDSTGVDRHTPVDVVGLGSGIAAITAGGNHSCALTTGGAVKCWGYNGFGQLGDGTQTPRYTAVDVAGLGSGVTAISAGYAHTCALTAGGNVKCWGRGQSGEIGDGLGLARLTPTGVSGLSTNGIAKVVLGEAHTCALTVGGGVKCWGFNGAGELGNNTTVNSLTPVDAVGLTSGVTSIAAATFHTCAVTSSGGTKCWGHNTSGSLGDGSASDRYVPTDVFNLSSGMASVTVGSNHSCALSTAGQTQCWGGNSLGVLGDGTYNQQLHPVVVLSQSGVYDAISAGNTVTCGLVSGGTVQCWGANNAGQLGVGGVLPPAPPGKTNIPGTVPGLASIAMMDAGGDHVCVLTPVGGLKCWGANSSGQTGDGSTTDRSSPTDVVGLGSGVGAISSGVDHTCALTVAGGVKCWGNNTFGKLGDGSSTNRSLPVDVVGLATGIASVEAGYLHTCALTTAGGVKCWGHNLNGQLGDNSTTPQLTPVVALIGGQSITFTPSPGLVPGVPTTLSATASSGLAVTFDTWTPGICSIIGNSVTANSVGLCGIRASQSGNGGISAAPQQLRALRAVYSSPPPTVPTINGVRPGIGSVIITFTAPGNSVGTVYAATCVSAGGASTKQNTGGTSPIVVRGLTGGVSYSCSVSATNEGGTVTSTIAAPVVALRKGIAAILMLLLN